MISMIFHIQIQRHLFICVFTLLSTGVLNIPIFVGLCG